MIDFLEWLNAEMERGEVTQADIARTGILSDAAVSLFFSGKTKKVTFEMCKAISQATNIPLEIVYRKAGLLPKKPDSDLWTEKMIHKLSKVPESMRDVVSKTIDAFIAGR